MQQKGKNFIKITGVGMGSAKSTETRENLKSGPCLLRMFKLFEAQKETYLGYGRCKVL